MEDELKTQFFNKLLVVLVIYKMKISESPAYQSLTDSLLHNEETASLFIYDNSSSPQELPTNPCWNVYYNHDFSNPGVSKAYNQGFKKAKELDKKWLLLVDQDTVFPLNSLDKYYESVAQHKHHIIVPILRDRMGIVSPFKFSFGGGVRIKEIDTLVPLKLKDYFVVNSGLLISSKAFERAGGYDENLPLDFSDIAFINRLKSEVEFFLIAEIVCQHQLSDSGNTSLSERLKRFKKHIAASRYFKKHYSKTLLIPARVFLQSLKLSFQYLNIKFIILYIK